MKDSPEFFKEFGQRIARIRKEQNITQVQMAGSLGVSQQAVASYENGVRRIPLSMLAPIAKVLSVPVQELLDIKINSKRGPSSKMQQKIEKIRKLPAGKQKVAMDMLDTILESAGKS